MHDLKRDRRFRYIIVFKNHGKAAGSSVDHSHSQLIALPIVPREVRDEMDGARAHYTAKERCVFCDIISQDSRDGRRLIAENADMVAMAPYAPRFPFETWILPKRHQAQFEDAPRHEYASLARLLGDILRRMNKTLRNPPYNLLIHTAPLAEPAGDFYHWHVEIIPEADEGCRLRVGHRVLREPDRAGRSGRRPPRRALVTWGPPSGGPQVRGGRLQAAFVCRRGGSSDPPE